MSDLTKLSLAAAVKGLKNKEFTATEMTTQYIKAMEMNKSLNAYITETPDRALEDAKASDARIQSGNALPLDGVPIAQKDLYCTKGVRTTAASKILENFIPPYESTVSQKLKAAGTVLLGKTSMDEFAMGSANITSAYGPVINPWKRHADKTDLVPGGSSGGSAAAVSAGLAVAATGSDTGGSIRQSAAFTGLVGLNPTYGRCSRWGVIAFASSLDRPGPIARTVEDAAMMLQHMAGHDPKDSTSVRSDVPNFVNAITGNIKGLKVGIPKEYQMDGMSEEIVKLWQKAEAWLKDAGAEVVEISLPHTAEAVPAYYIIAPAEASANLARYDGVRYGARVNGDSLDELYEATRAAGFGAEVKRRIMMGTYALSAGFYDAYYIKAQKVRRLIANDFEEAYKKVDVILTPTTPNPAFGVNEKLDLITMYMNDVFTGPASLAGVPGISVPAGLSSTGLPLGLQLIGKSFEEGTLLNAASVIEKAAQFPSLLSLKEAA